MLREEATRWLDLFASLDQEKLAEPRTQFGQGNMDVRGFVQHMLQNMIYKHGQFTTMYFGFGLDGEETYEAPFPNPIYKLMREGKLPED